MKHKFSEDWQVLRRPEQTGTIAQSEQLEQMYSSPASTKSDIREIASILSRLEAEILGIKEMIQKSVPASSVSSDLLSSK